MTSTPKHWIASWHLELELDLPHHAHVQGQQHRPEWKLPNKSMYKMVSQFLGKKQETWEIHFVHENDQEKTQGGHDGGNMGKPLATVAKYVVSKYIKSIYVILETFQTIKTIYMYNSIYIYMYHYISLS